jgi:tRNA-specific 2-thiouridylase
MIQLAFVVRDRAISHRPSRRLSSWRVHFHVMPEQDTIAIAMSGGVDSSAVAALLHAQGHPLVGLTLQLWNQRRLAGREGMPESVQGRCCSIDDVYDARRVAEHLGIPYYLVNAQDRFEEEVVRPFVAEYLAGRTPIPCTLCNNHLKFDQLLLTARQIGAERIATGHYARNHFDSDRGRWILSRPSDRSKDQTYFLFGLTQEQLSRTLFPLGEMQKPAVRTMAAEHGLELAQKPDSQEICFIPGGSYSQFLKAYLDEQGRELPDSAGELVSTSGQVVGRHEGIHGFTVGQRKGLGISSPDPLYVLKIHPDSHKVEVGSVDQLLSRTLTANRLNWVSIPEPQEPIRVAIKIRHRHEPAAATLHVVNKDLVEAIFDEPQRAITPGQSAVFYQGDEVAGGGCRTESAQSACQSLPAAPQPRQRPA